MVGLPFRQRTPFRAATVLATCVSMVLQLIGPAFFSFLPVRVALAASTVNVNSFGLMNGFFPGAPIKASSDPKGIVKLEVTASSVGQTLTSVTVSFGGTGFTTTTLADIATGSGSGVALYQDDGLTTGSFDASDSVITLGASPNWASNSSTITLTPATSASLTSGMALTFYVVIRTAAIITNGVEIRATIPAGGVTTTDGNGPSTAFAAPNYRTDTSAPTISSISAYSGSATITVRFSESVQKVGFGNLAVGDGPLAYTDAGGTAQTISALSHTLGQEIVSLTMSGALDATDVDGSPASISVVTNKIIDMAGNVAANATTSLSSPLGITTPNIPAAATGTTYSSGAPLVTFAASGGSGSYVFSPANEASTSSLVMAGLALATDGKLTGTATTTPGSYSLLVRVNDGSTSTTRPFTLNVGSASGGGIPNIHSVTPASGAVNSTNQYIRITGSNTSFTNASVVSFSLPSGSIGTNGITVVSASSSGATSLGILIDISSSATSGPRDVQVQTGGQSVISPSGFGVYSLSGTSGLTQLNPLENVTGVLIPPSFTFLHTSQSSALSYRISLKTSSDTSGAVAPIWDYVLPKATDGAHCNVTQCNVNYGAGFYRILVPPTALSAGTDYYWQVRSYSTTTSAVSDLVAPLESTSLRKFTTVSSIVDMMPPNISFRPIFRATASSNMTFYARIFDNVANASSTPALTARVYSCAGVGCTPTEYATAISTGAGYFRFVIPSATIGTAGTIVRYYLWASDGTNITMFKEPGGTPFTLTSTAAGSADTTGTVVNGSGVCIAAVREAVVFAEGTAFSANTDASCAYTLSGLYAGMNDLVAFKDGFGERRIDGIPAGTTGIAFQMSTGTTSGFGGDTTRPRVRMTGPMDGARNLPGGESGFKIFLVFSKPMSQTSIETSGNLTVNQVNLATGGLQNITASGTWTYYTTAPATPIPGVPSEANMAVWTLNGSNTLGDNKTIAVKVLSNVTDASGNAVQGNQPDGSYALNFTTGGTSDGSFGGGSYGSGSFLPPRVNGVTPAPGSVSVAINTRVIIGFSEAMADDRTGYTLRDYIKLFTVSGSSETDVSSSVISTATLDTTKKNAIVTFSSDLTASTRYRLKILGGAKSSTNLDLRRPGEGTSVAFTSDFTTGASGDVTAATINGSFPDNNATNVSVGSSAIGVSFSRDMDASTISTDTFYLSIGSTVVNGSVEYRPLERQAMFIPRSALNATTTYTMTIGAGIRALNGTSMTATTTRSFTTGGADATAPTINFVNVDDHAIAITFSEPMNAAQAVDSLNWARSVLNPLVYDVIKYGSSGFDPSSAGTAVSLSSARFQWEPMTNTVILEGVSLGSAIGQQLYMSLDVTGSNVAKDISGNLITSSGNSGRATVRNTATTGGFLSPMSGPGPSGGGSSGFVPTNFSTSTFGFARRIEARPFNMMAGQTTIYGLRIPISTQIPAGGTIDITFPSGFNVTGAMQDIRSPMRSDLNGPGTESPTYKCTTNVAGGKSCEGGATVTGDTAAGGTGGGLADDGVTVSGQVVTVHLSEATNAGGNDFLTIDIAGIVNTTSPRDFNTTGYTISLMTKNGSTVLETGLTSQPIFIQSAGSYTLTGNITTTGNDQSCTMKVYLNSPATGPLETTSANFSDAVSGASDGATVATYSFSNLPAGEYFLFTDRMNTCGSKEFAGKTIPERLSINGGMSYNFTLADNTTGGTNVTVNVDGPSLERVDIFAGSPTGFKVIQRTLDSSAGAEAITFNLADGNWFVGVGPQMPSGMNSGPPPSPSYIMPKPKDLKVSGSTCTVDGAFGCTLTFTLTTASKQIKGIVKDGSSRLMANAEVYAYSPQGGFGTRAETDATGVFTLNVVAGTFIVGSFIPGMPPTKEVPVTVASSGAAYLFIDGTSTGVTPAVAASTFILSVAKPDYTITGKVTDGTNVVKGASVFAYRTDAPGGVNAITDSSGAYTLYVSNGTWRVGVFLPQYGKLTEQTITVSGASHSDVNFSPSQTGTFYTVSGRVYSDTSGDGEFDAGEGTASAFVRISGNGTFNETITSATGTYRFNVPAGSGYVVRAHVPGVGELPALAAFAVAANVTDKDFSYGTPNAITFTFSTTVAQAFIEAQTTTGQGGRADVTNATSVSMSLSNGSYQVKVFVPGVNIGPSDFSATTGDTTINSTTGVLTVNSNEGVTITVPALRTVSGSVTDGSVVLSDAWVEIVHPTSSVRTGMKTDASGAFSLKVVDSPSGPYRINAMKPGYFREPSSITVNGSNLASQTLTLTAATTSISGQITIGGVGAANAFVRAEKQGGGFSGTQADSNGNYTLYVNNGTWKVYALAQGYAEAGLASNPLIITGSVTGKNIALTTSVALDPPHSQPITPSNGGTFSNDTLGVRIEIPANALGTDTSAANVSVSETNNLRRTSSAIPLSTGVDLSAVDADGNRLANFSDTVNVSRDVAIAEIRQTTSSNGTLMDSQNEADDLQMGYWDETTSNWVTLGSTVTYLDASGAILPDPADNLSDVATVRITAATDHFSLYAPVVATDPSAAATPSGLGASAASASAINLSWTTVSGATGYDLYRSTSEGGTYARLGGEPTVSSGATVTYGDTGLSAGTQYFYKISSLNVSGESTSSAAVYTTTNAAPAASVTSGGGGGSGFSGSISTTFIPLTPAPTPTVTTPPPTPAPISPAPVTVAPAPVQPTTPVSTVPAPTVPPAVVQVVPPKVVSDVRFLDEGVKLNVTVAQKVKFVYEYKNTSKATQDVVVTREWVNVKGKVIVRSTAKTRLKPNASWKKQVQETVPKKIVPGAYVMRIRVTDKKGKVLGQNDRQVEVKAKVPTKKVKAPAKKK